MRVLKEGEEIAQGKIEDSNVKETEKWQKISFKIGGVWYASFCQDLQKFKDGQDVKLIWKWDKTRKYRNVVDDCMEKFSEEEIKEEPPQKKTSLVTDKDKIVRQCCLKCACELFEAIDVERILEIAEKFEEWVHR